MGAEDLSQRRGPSRRQLAAAKIVEAYFKPSAAVVEKGTPSRTAANDKVPGPAVKKRKLQQPAAPIGPNFGEELLAKAPAAIQTCRSLQLFLDKKLEEKEADAPELKGPESIQERLKLLASLLGRIASVEEKSGWDARAKRVLDISQASKTDAGQVTIANVKTKVESLRSDLSKELKKANEAGGGFEDDPDVLVSERKAWEHARLRRGWLGWCSRLLKAREAILLAKADGKKPDAGSHAGKQLGTSDILEALLEGKTPSA